MKVFTPGNEAFVGSLNFIYSKTEHNFPKVEIKGTKEKDEAINVIAEPLTANIFYTPDTNHTNIDIGKYKLLPSHYQLSTAIGGTPPLNFSLLGSNSLNKEFVPIDKYRYDPYICPYEMGSSNTACKERTIKLITLNNTFGPYRYIRYTCHFNRWELGHQNIRDYAIRIGGIEIYGILYDTKYDKFLQRTCHHRLNSYELPNIILIISLSN